MSATHPTKRAEPTRFLTGCRGIVALLLTTLFLITAVSGATAAICPFCSAVNMTLTEQIRSKDITVFAKLVKLPEPIEDPDIDDLPKATFEIVDVIKGANWVEPGMQFRALIVGAYSEGQEFLVMGINPPTVKWTMPNKSTPRLKAYVAGLAALPASGPDRLEYFQGYLEDQEPIMAFDSYDEFATSSYEDMIELKDRMNHDQLVEWIKDKETLINRRRLYLTMLGICGDENDVPMLEEFLRSDDRMDRAGLDAMAACYLTLAGERAIDLLEEKFLANKDADYGDTTAVIGALRFIGTETNLIPKERIVAAIRVLLDRPKLADSVIHDLARWEDWSVMEKLVQMYKDADDDTVWLRTPVITYLRACPLPEAKIHIEELRKIDPDAVRRADFFLELSNEEFADFDDADIADDDDIPDLDEPEIDEPEIDEPETNTESAPATNVPASGDSGTGSPATATGTDDSETELPADQSGGGTTFTSLANETADSHVVRKVPVDVPVDANVVLEGSLVDSELVNSELVGTELDDSDRNVVTDSNHTPLSAVQDTVTDSLTMDSTGMESTMTSGPRTQNTNEIPVAQTNQPVAPPVAAIEPSNLMVKVILLPMAVSLILFMVLWSVLSGWFERLIF